MLKNKVLYYVVTIFLLTVILVGCNSEEASTDGSDYPNDNIEVTIPYSAGGGTDLLARNVSKTVEDILGTSMVVTNKTGSGGETGMDSIAKEDPDGYHLGVLNFPDNVVLATYKETDYSNDDYEYLASYTSSPAVLIGKKDKFNNLEELIEYAKENPGGITVGVASDAHIYTMIALEEEADIELTPVMNESGNESYNNVLGGHIDVAVVAQQFAGQAADEGLPLLGVASEERIETLPDAPTFTELGYDVDLVLSRVFVTPKDTPDEVINKLIEAFDKAAEDDDLVETIINSGEGYEYKSGSELKEVLKDKSEKIEKVMKGNEDKFGL